MKVLLLFQEDACLGAIERLRAMAEEVICMKLEEGLGGVWSEFDAAGREMIRVGYPGESRHPYFQLFAPKRGVETCASVVIGRTVFGRGISDVVVPEEKLEIVATHALEHHDVRRWFGGTLPENS